MAFFSSQNQSKANPQAIWRAKKAHKKRPTSVLEVMIAARGLPEAAQDGPKTV